MWGTGLLPRGPGGHLRAGSGWPTPTKSRASGSLSVPPDLGGDLGGAAVGSDPPTPPRPHQSQEPLGSHPGEEQLSLWGVCAFAKLFPLPFCFRRTTPRSSDGVVCLQSLEPPLPPLSLVPPQRRRPAPQPWHGAGLGGGGGSVQGSPALKERTPRERDTRV